MDINQIQLAITADRLRITDHADEEMAADGLTLSEVLFAVNRGEIIEDYPTDHPLPSCLILGKTTDESPVHSVWAYNESRSQAILITCYRPDPERWIELRVRKPKS